MSPVYQASMLTTARQQTQARQAGITLTRFGRGMSSVKSSPRWSRKFCTQHRPVYMLEMKIFRVRAEVGVSSTLCRVVHA